MPVKPKLEKARSVELRKQLRSDKPVQKTTTAPKSAAAKPAKAAAAKAESAKPAPVKAEAPKPAKSAAPVKTAAKPAPAKAAPATNGSAAPAASRKAPEPVAVAAVVRRAPLSAAAKAAIRAKSQVPETEAVHAVVENIQPSVDGGRFAIKAIPGEVIDPRTDIERLAATIALAQQRLADHQRIVRRDESADREAIDRRRCDDRKITHAGQRQLQGTRNRRRAERQHVHLGAELLELFLMGDAEVLFLVNDEQAEVLELDGLAGPKH